MIWVTLDLATATRVEECGGTDTAPGAYVRPPHDAPATPPSPRPHAATTAGASGRMRINGRIEGDRCVIPISSGNITNRHIYLRSVLAFFPQDCVGGSDRDQPARRLLTVTFAHGPSVVTDIAGPDTHARKGRSAHYFFRNARGETRDFFARAGAEPGDEVVIERRAPHSYAVSLKKSTR